jgi:hypothetical protein
MPRRVCAFALVAAASLSCWSLAAEGDQLPAPPRPPAGAKVAPSEAVPAPAPTAPAAIEGLSYGSVVSEGVAAYPHVRVGDPHKVAPGAVPVLVAVRDPNACRKGPAGMVFVQVCLPPCPPCKVSVNKLGTKVELDYGKYEVDLISRNGVVIIDYDW